MANQINEIRLADDATITLARYRDPEDGQLKVAMGIAVRTVDSAGESIRAISRDDVMGLLAPATRTAITNNANTILAKIAQLLGVDPE